MKTDEYTALIADLMSDRPERVRSANRELFEVLGASSILTDTVDYHPDLVLADAEQINRDQSPKT